MRCSARAPFGVLRRVLFRTFTCVGVGLSVSACANSYASYDAPANVGARVHNQVAIAAPSRIELEDDGLAVQAPPRVRKNVEPDDPSEPFSPNYGPSPDSEEPVREKSPPASAAQAPRLQYRSRTTEMTPEEAQSIIVRAMVAHEQRNP